VWHHHISGPRWSVPRGPDPHTGRSCEVEYAHTHESDGLADGAGRPGAGGRGPRYALWSGPGSLQGTNSRSVPDYRSVCAPNGPRTDTPARIAHAGDTRPCVRCNL